MTASGGYSPWPSQAPVEVRKAVRKSCFAPAKINLCLHVLGKRRDGYHELAMLMQRVSLGDRIDIAVTATPGIRIRCDRLRLAPGEENLAGRAAEQLLRRVAGPVGVDIDIDKRIPVAAGLGGGSSDAATVLLALNDMLGLALAKRELMEIGVRLGADVPFFIFEEAAWATGIGERLEKAPPLPPVWYVLVNPGFSVSTAQTYRKLGLTSLVDTTRLPRFPGTIQELVAQLHNDLEAVTRKDFPVVAALKRRLVESGAAGALMSGSGPTVFGVFEGEGVARSAAADLERNPDWKVFVAQPV